MKRNTIVLVTLCSSIAILGIIAPAKGEIGQNSIESSISIGEGTTDVGIEDNYPIPPYDDPLY